MINRSIRKSSRRWELLAPVVILLSLPIVRSTAADKLVVWDGDQITDGQSWVAPQRDTNSYKPQAAEAHSGKTALELRAEGAEWVGGGWNWHGWWPPTAGADTTRFTHLTFWLKVKGRFTNQINVWLNCSATKKECTKVNLFDYVKDVADGQWHELVIPLADLTKEQTGFDPKTVWEFDLGTWSPETGSISLFVDDIAFENRSGPAPAVQKP